MINILIDELPEKVGNMDINSDFRVSILFELLMQDKEFSDEEKIEQALILYYPNLQQINDYNKAVENIVWFYKCGKKDKNVDGENNVKNKQKQIYSYEFDDDKIYSAFIQQYKIDLQKHDLHWWQFKSMFESLTDETQIVQIMQYRATDLSKIKDKKERKRIKELQDLYKLPDMRTEEEKENDFANQFL